MTSTQMDFLGYKSFEYNVKAEEVNIVLQMDNIGEIPVLIQLKNGKLESAKVQHSLLLLTLGCI